MTNKSNSRQKPRRIHLDHDWRYQRVDAANDITSEVSSANTDDQPWISVQLPHVDALNGRSTRATTTLVSRQNWWYRRRLQWEDLHPKPHQRIHLLFEPMDDGHRSRLAGIDSSQKMFRVWFNELEVLGDSPVSRPSTIELSEQLLSLIQSRDADRQATLTVCCTNTSLTSRAYLLLSDELSNVQMSNVSETKTWKPNHVLDHLVHFDDHEGRLNITDDSTGKSPSRSSPLSMSHGYLDETQNYLDGPADREATMIEGPHVPRLNIVMLIVGTRGDVQPFIR